MVGTKVERLAKCKNFVPGPITRLKLLYSNNWRDARAKDPTLYRIVLGGIPGTQYYRDLPPTKQPNNQTAKQPNSRTSHTFNIIAYVRKIPAKHSPKLFSFLIGIY